MKVSLCPKCNVTPNISSTELRCPKCGRVATGKDLAETVGRWNSGETSNAEEAPVTEEVAEPLVEEIKEELPEKKPIKTKKATKKGKE